MTTLQLEKFVLIPANYLPQQQQHQNSLQDSREGKRLQPQKQPPQFVKEAKKEEQQGEEEKPALLEYHIIPTATSASSAYNNKRMRIQIILKRIGNHSDVFLNTSDKTVRVGLGTSAAAIGDTTPTICVLQFLKELPLQDKNLPPQYRNILKFSFPLKNSADNLI